MVVKIVVYHVHASESCLGHSYHTGGGDQTCATSGVTVTNALREFTKILSGFMQRADAMAVSETGGSCPESMTYKVYLYFVPVTVFGKHNVTRLMIYSKLKRALDITKQIFSYE